jgi:hypothetical protein
VLFERYAPASAEMGYSKVQIAPFTLAEQPREITENLVEGLARLTPHTADGAAKALPIGPRDVITA